MAAKLIYEQVEGETNNLINIFLLISTLLVPRITEMNCVDMLAS